MRRERVARPRGLRARLIAALALTSAVTLGAVAITLLSPLQNRLRNERLSTLAGQANQSKRTLERLDPSVLTPGSKVLRRVIRDLHSRTSADVALLDDKGRVLAATDVDKGRFVGLPTTLRRRPQVRRVVDAGGESEAEVAIRVDVGGRPYVLVAAKSLNDVDAAVRSVIQAFTIAAVIGLGTALAIGVGLASRLTRRLEALRAAALKVADLGPGPEVEMASDPGRDEVGDLSRAFATMRARLNEQEQARRRFVSTASHELRTPLSSLQLMLDLLEEEVAEGNIDAAEVGRQLGRAKGQAARITKLAAELLDLSRIDAGVPLRRELVELGDLARSVITEFEPAEHGTGKSIELDAPERCWVVADPGSIARIIRILVDNALRFSPPDGPVRVVASCAGPAPTLTVADSGPGVTEENRELIFERFRRGDEPAGDGGFGLGLAIARELARRMDGDVRLEDQAAGEGARFTLALPGAPAVADGEAEASGGRV
jgi:signal transduction histidine kinase